MTTVDTVTMTHPTLPDHVGTVPASSVPQHQRAGWQVADAPTTSRRRRTPKTPPPASPAADAEPTTTPDAAPAAETPESE